MVVRSPRARASVVLHGDVVAHAREHLLRVADERLPLRRRLQRSKRHRRGAIGGEVRVGLGLGAVPVGI